MRWVVTLFRLLAWVSHDALIWGEQSFGDTHWRPQLRLPGPRGLDVAHRGSLCGTGLAGPACLPRACSWDPAEHNDERWEKSHRLLSQGGVSGAPGTFQGVSNLTFPSWPLGFSLSLPDAGPELDLASAFKKGGFPKNSKNRSVTSRRQTQAQPHVGPVQLSDVPWDQILPDPGERAGACKLERGLGIRWSFT